MSNTLKSLLLFLLIFYAGHSYGQASSDHLEPVGGIYDMYGNQFEYYSNVRKVLFDGLTDSPEIRYLVLPSFYPESVLDIEYIDFKYYMFCHIGDRMIWRIRKLSQIKVEKFKTEIDKESVKLIKSLFDVAIAQTKFPEDNILGMDGADHYFTINKFGQKSGKVWSPSDGTRMKKLVDIGNELMKLSKSKVALVTFDPYFRKRIESLIGEFK